jgi:hypothetical protein
MAYCILPSVLDFDAGLVITCMARCLFLDDHEGPDVLGWSARDRGWLTCTHALQNFIARSRLTRIVFGHHGHGDLHQISGSVPTAVEGQAMQPGRSQLLLQNVRADYSLIQLSAFFPGAVRQDRETRFLFGSPPSQAKYTQGYSMSPSQDCALWSACT